LSVVNLSVSDLNLLTLKGFFATFMRMAKLSQLSSLNIATINKGRLPMGRSFNKGFDSKHYWFFQRLILVKLHKFT